MTKSLLEILIKRDDSAESLERLERVQEEVRQAYEAKKDAVRHAEENNGHS